MQLTLDKDISMRSVEQAAELAGGYEELAARLGVRPEQVIDWSLGVGTPDTAAFLFVLDVIMQETQKLASAAIALGLMEQALAKARSSSKPA